MGRISRPAQAMQHVGRTKLMQCFVDCLGRQRVDVASRRFWQAGRRSQLIRILIPDLEPTDGARQFGSIDEI